MSIRVLAANPFHSHVQLTEIIDFKIYIQIA